MAAEDITAQGIAALEARAPAGADVAGTYDADLGDHGCWTWSVVAPAPTEEEPDRHLGVSRQYVAPEADNTPSSEAIDLMVTEMLSTIEGAHA